MPLRGAIAVGPYQRGFHSGIVLAKPLGKALQLTAWTGEGPLEPGLQPLRGPLPHQPCKGLRVGGKGCNQRIGLLDLEQLGLLGFRTRVRTAEQAIRHRVDQMWDVAISQMAYCSLISRHPRSLGRSSYPPSTTPLPSQLIPT